MKEIKFIVDSLKDSNIQTLDIKRIVGKAGNGVR